MKEVYTFIIKNLLVAIYMYLLSAIAHNNYSYVLMRRSMITHVNNIYGVEAHELKLFWCTINLPEECHEELKLHSHHA